MTKFTVLIFSLVLLFAFGLQAQTMTYKTGYQFPTFAQDSVLSGLKSVRGSDFHQDPLGEGVAAFAATNYNYNGFIHVFKAAGDDSMELVWTSPAFDSLGGSSYPRHVKWADMDNDGTIELVAVFSQNGIVIFEWDGVADSWNFGDAPARVIASPLYPTADSSTSYNRTEFLDVADVDNDGYNELFFGNNSTGTTFDRYYGFSIEGTYSTGDPGFSSVKREMHFPRDGAYGAYGGGTPYAVIAAELDGTGNKELIFHNWNNGHVSPVRVTAADTYELADTTGGGHYIWAHDPAFGVGGVSEKKDAVSLGGGTAYDIDGDGREEVYIPFYSAEKGFVMMVHYEGGDDLSKIDSTNVFMLDLSSVYSSSSFYGLAGYGDYDVNGKPNLYFAGRQGQYIATSEFQGGDKTDPANWIHEILYDGLDLDSKILVKKTIKDSASTVWTADSTLQSTDEGTIAFKISAFSTFFDDDNFEDIIMPSQTWLDSIAVTKLTWNGTSYDTTKYNELEPYRISIRMLESDQFNSIEAKDLTVILPDDYKLFQNYPNPFNPTTNIEFYLPIQKRISLTVYNALGQKIKTLVNDKVFSKGTHMKEWDATNNSGMKVATGMYIYELKYGNFKKYKRMMLVK